MRAVNHLSIEELAEFEKSLLYLKMNELREICLKLHIPNKEQKTKLIEKILAFAKTGEIIPTPQIPAVSKAIKSKSYPLKPSTLILKGSYKNDYATRDFFKELIGNHFHFTAYGIDWINDRWLEGNPPTYQEFADFWEREYRYRKTKKAPAKKEWQYIRFVQDYIQKFPHDSKEKILEAWNAEREKHVLKATNFLSKIL